jgi:hypothetical protein
LLLLLLQITTLAGQEYEGEEDKKNLRLFFVSLPFPFCPEKQHKVALFSWF